MTGGLVRAIVAVLAAGWCLTMAVGVGAQEATPASDPAAAAAEQARQQAEASASNPRFDPTAYGFGGCMNEPPAEARIGATVPPGVDLAVIPNAAGWLVSAPRGGASPGAPVELSLRDKAGARNRMVYADIYRPDGTFARAGSTLFGSRDTKLTYPLDFRDGQPLVPGSYTVIWRDTITDRFLACDGFVVQGA